MATYDMWTADVGGGRIGCVTPAGKKPPEGEGWEHAGTVHAESPLRAALEARHRLGLDDDPADWWKRGGGPGD